jgi:hypothetical protein
MPRLVDLPWCGYGSWLCLSDNLDAAAAADVVGGRRPQVLRESA